MKNLLLPFLLSIFVLAGCAKKVPVPILVQIPSRPINYLHEVKPVLDKRCAVCHSCYNSLMLQTLNHKMNNPEVKGDYFSETDDQTCPATGIELDGYLSKHPNRGMPFGFPSLTQDEFELI